MRASEGRRRSARVHHRRAPPEAAGDSPQRRARAARAHDPQKPEDEMNGSMMQLPLLISTLLVHAERHHGEQEVVSRRVEGDIHRTTYRELAARSRRMANALAGFGIKSGDSIATRARTGFRHSGPSTPGPDPDPLLTTP